MMKVKMLESGNKFARRVLSIANVVSCGDYHCTLDFTSVYRLYVKTCVCCGE